MSDKKTSTPNRTPTRKRELRPRYVLCKKNIALSTTDSTCNEDFVNELAALNDMVNSDQAQNIKPAQTSQESCGNFYKHSPKKSSMKSYHYF